MNIKTIKSKSASDLFDQVALFTECKYRKVVDVIWSCINYDDVNANLYASVVYQCKY